MAFKDVLRRLRKQDGLTQADLAARLGVAKSTISMYECGNREPDFETLEALADLFNVDMDFLTDRASQEKRLSSRLANFDSPAYVISTSFPPFSDPAKITLSEYAIVLAYRKASSADRQIIDNIVERYSPSAENTHIG